MPPVSLAASPHPPAERVPSLPCVSLVLPAYNEEENIEEAVATAAAALPAISETWEIIIVNDGSTDGTGALADRLAAIWPGRLRVIHHPANRGKGAALRNGLRVTRASIVAYTDADLPFDMEALALAYARLVDTGADLVAGYRTNREHYSLQRRIYSGTYNWLIRATLGLPLDDVAFALKLMRREVLEAIDLESEGGFVDVELLARAHALGYRIERLGVAFTPRVRGVSTMASVGSVLRIVHELVRFRLRQRHTRRVEQPVCTTVA